MNDPRTTQRAGESIVGFESEAAFVEDFRQRWTALDAEGTVCAALSPDHERVCIRQLGHAEPHPWTPNQEGERDDFAKEYDQGYDDGYHNASQECVKALDGRDRTIEQQQARIEELETALSRIESHHELEDDFGGRCGCVAIASTALNQNPPNPREGQS